MVESKKGFHMPHALEAVVLNLMVDASTGEKSYGEKPFTYTRCVEKVSGKCRVVVGGFDSLGLGVCNTLSFDGEHLGAAVVIRGSAGTWDL